MNPLSRLFVVILAAVVLVAGFLVTFTFITGVQNPIEFLSKVQFSVSTYLLIGVILLACVIGAGILIFLKEKVLGYS